MEGDVENRNGSANNNDGKLRGEEATWHYVLDKSLH